MRIKVGFFTVRHPEIDPRVIGASNITLWEHTYNAPDVAVAMLKAKRDVPVDELEKEVQRRWPNCKYAAYTHQIQNRRAWVSWGRSFSSISLDDIRRIQRDDLTVGEQVVAKRGGRAR